MKILITGGLGFIGSSIAKKCVELEHDVYILSRSKDKIENIKSIEHKVTIYQHSLEYIHGITFGMDVIFHCASTVDNYNIFNDPYIDAETNVLGTISLLESCRKYNPNVNVIFLSTFFVNGRVAECPVLTYATPNPMALYGATKLCAEHICNTYNRVFDMNIKIVRIANVFGVNEKGSKTKAAFNWMIEKAVNGKTIKLYGGGSVLRDYIYIDDVVSGLIFVMNKGSKYKTYHISRGEGVKLSRLVAMVLEETDGNCKVEVVSPPEFHKQVGIDDFWYDISEMNRLGWEPKVSLREGIKKVVEFYKGDINE